MTATLAPRFQDIAFFLAATGYHEEAEQAVGTCSELWEDTMLWRCLGPHTKWRLDAAVAIGHFGRVLFLLKHGARPTAATLHSAVDRGFNDILAILLPWCEGQLDVEQVYIGFGRHVSSMTPLMRAAKHGNAEAVRMLLGAGAAINHRGPSSGWTALDYATTSSEPGWFACANYLKRRGAKTEKEILLRAKMDFYVATASAAAPAAAPVEN